MKVAIPNWQGRVSPVFDVAGRVLVVDINAGKQTERQHVLVDVEDPKARASRLKELGVDVLICGAISWPLALAIEAAGIRLIPQTCGGLEEVLSAFIHGRLHENAFLMPGCRGRCQKFRTQHLARES